VTFAILRVIKFFTPLRMSDADLVIGDMAAHGEEAYPVEVADRAIPALVGAGTPDDGSGVDDDRFVSQEVVSD
jgi:hypothetical protein